MFEARDRRRPPSSFNKLFKMSPGYCNGSKVTALQLGQRREREEEDVEETREGKEIQRAHRQAGWKINVPFLPFSFPGFYKWAFPTVFPSPAERKGFTCDLPQVRWGLIKKDEKKRCHPYLGSSGSRLPLGNNTSRLWGRVSHFHQGELMNVNH